MRREADSITDHVSRITDRTTCHLPHVTNERTTMPIKILVPELGESVIEATVGKWLKKEGDRVAPGETVVELETDKVDLEVGAERAGVLIRIEKKEGEDVRVGDVLGLIGESAEEAPPAPQPTPPRPEERPAPTAATSAPSRENIVPPRQEPPPPEKIPSETRPPAPSQQAPSPASGDGDRATPVARRMAEEQGIDLAEVPATGPGGRITKQDVEAFIENRRKAAAPSQMPLPPAKAPEAPVTALQVTREGVSVSARADREERVRMSRRRRTIAQRLVEAHQTAAMLTTFNEIDMSAVMEMRTRRKEAFQKEHEISLGFMSFFVKATVGALKKFPLLNAEIQGDEIVLKHYYDIGIAVGAEEGLVVPVLRDADRLSFAEIERRIKEFAQKAREGTLSLQDLRGGTFTISNGGVYGSLMSTPILNTPEVGVLGLHKIEERAVALQGQVVIRPMMYVALTYDHRLVDGREAVQFLVRVKALVEDPEALLLEG